MSQQLHAPIVQLHITASHFQQIHFLLYTSKYNGPNQNHIKPGFLSCRHNTHLGFINSCRKSNKIIDFSLCVCARLLTPKHAFEYKYLLTVIFLQKDINVMCKQIGVYILLCNKMPTVVYYAFKIVDLMRLAFAK